MKKNKKKVKPCSPIAAPSYYRKTQVKKEFDKKREAEIIENYYTRKYPKFW